MPHTSLIHICLGLGLGQRLRDIYERVRACVCVCGGGGSAFQSRGRRVRRLGTADIAFT